MSGLFVESSSAITDKAKNASSWVVSVPGSPWFVAVEGGEGEFHGVGLRRAEGSSKIAAVVTVEPIYRPFVAPKMAPPMMSSSNDYLSIKAIQMEKRTQFYNKKKKLIKCINIVIHQKTIKSFIVHLKNPFGLSFLTLKIKHLIVPLN